MSDDRYARVRFSIMDDPKFDGIRENTGMLGAWTLCLVVAEMAWPSPAFRPPWVSDRQFAALVDHGLVDPTPNGCYRIHGLDAERSRRTEQARTASNARWNAPSIPASNAPAVGPRMPSKAKQSKSIEEQHSTRATDPADAYWTLTGKYPTDKTLAWIDDLAGQYGADQVSWQMAHQHTLDDSCQTLLGRVRDALKREARQLDLAEQQDEQARLKVKRATGVNVPLMVARHNHGQHAAEPEPGCPACANGKPEAVAS